jgi:hypothetical protein
MMPAAASSDVSDPDGLGTIRCQAGKSWAAPGTSAEAALPDRVSTRWWPFTGGASVEPEQA